MELNPKFFTVEVCMNKLWTIAHELKLSRGDGVPTIGDNVQIGCGTAIFGGIRIGNNVCIGANAVVWTDIPENAIAVGVPAKVVGYSVK